MLKSIVLADSCTGCALCEAVCPKDAISFVDSVSGFPIPVVNPERCVSCGLCARKCERVHSLSGYTDHSFYEAWLSNAEERRACTSGGIVTALAKNILLHGGVVFGVTMEGCARPHYIAVEREADLAKIQGSRYLQADASGCYRRLIAELERGRPVLFTGMACHAKAVKTLCANRYANLLLVDFACFGVPSSLLFTSFLRSRKIPQGEVEQVQFRHKRFGWRNYGMQIALRNGQDVFIPRQESDFMKGFISPLSLRESCYSCRGGIDDRVSDMTLGDLWGRPQQDDERDGVSFVITHTKKGEESLQEIREMIHLETTERCTIECGNAGIVPHQRPIPRLRRPFLRELSSGALLPQILQRYMSGNSLRKGVIIGHRFFPIPARLLKVGAVLKKILLHFVGKM